MMSVEEVRGAEKAMRAFRLRIGHRECSPICGTCRTYYRTMDWLATQRKRAKKRLGVEPGEGTKP